MSKNKILIIAAHPDDEILGCGGSIFQFKKNSLIKVVFLTNGVSARGNSKKNIEKRKNECLKLFRHLDIEKPIFFNFPDNQLDKIPLLKIIKKIEKILYSFKPNAVFTHYENCLNIDHKIAYQATITACRPINNTSVKKILSFEIPSSTDWAVYKGKNFQPNYFIDISKVIKKKLEAMNFYKSEIKKYPHSRSLKGIKSLASVRGTSSGLRYAEGFMLVRSINNSFDEN